MCAAKTRVTHQVSSRSGVSQSSVPLEAGTLVVGDLHLDVANAEHGILFERWCASLQDLPRLVILGDLFEFWVGDHHLRVAGVDPVLGALRGLTEAGVAVDVIHGNRDYLLGPGFEAATGARVHPEGLVIGVGDERAGIVHGDELCIADPSYQRLRRILRSGPILGLQRSLPLAIQIPLAKALRGSSERSTSQKRRAQVEMVPGAAQAMGDDLGVGTLICGHAHAARDQDLEGLRWIVLDAWGGPLDGARFVGGDWTCVSSSSGLERPLATY